MFTRDDTARLHYIRTTQTLGYTFEKTRHILSLSEACESPCREVRGIMRPCVKENRWRFVDLIAMQRRMEQALARREEIPHVPPSSGTICHLIESVVEARIEA